MSSRSTVVSAANSMNDRFSRCEAAQKITLLQQFPRCARTQHKNRMRSTGSKKSFDARTTNVCYQKYRRSFRRARTGKMRTKQTFIASAAGSAYVLVAIGECIWAFYRHAKKLGTLFHFDQCHMRALDIFDQSAAGSRGVAMSDCVDYRLVAFV
jgi:hypothetical protein